MKEKNKGFTLVELLAVIVILALIALIATPIILNVINDAKKQAAKDSAYGYMDAVEKYIVSSELEDESIPDGIYRVEDLNKKISVKGSTPDNTSNCAKSQVTSEYAWLFDYTAECTSHGCNKSDSNTWGYWTSSPYKGNSSSDVWRVFRLGGLGTGVVSDAAYGIRPVITISKSNIQ